MKSYKASDLPAVVDVKRLAAAKAGLPPAGVLRDATEVFKALANPMRVSIMHALSHEELSVGDLSRALELSISATSQQLSVLRRLGLVAGRDEGRFTFYRVVDELVGHLVHDCLAHVGGGFLEVHHAGTRPKGARRTVRPRRPQKGRRS
jgi:DNA-binding transcriptional ArsR family regulator